MTTNHWTPRFLICQAVGLCLVTAAWWLGAPQYLYDGDPTHLTALIAGLWALGVVASGAGWQKMADHIAMELPILGLLGTFIGLQFAVDAAAGDFEGMRQGLGTAFNTTIVGIVGSAWLRLTKAIR